jgi:hypothetical protein
VKAISRQFLCGTPLLEGFGNVFWVVICLKNTTAKHFVSGMGVHDLLKDTFILSSS